MKATELDAVAEVIADMLLAWLLNRNRTCFECKHYIYTPGKCALSGKKISPYTYACEQFEPRFGKEDVHGNINQ